MRQKNMYNDYFLQHSSKLHFWNPSVRSDFSDNLHVERRQLQKKNQVDNY
ncbi:unnamed protein product [Schistosoma mattheei]|uniref:Uncharacterized protein n=1 Tax=Schistosoma mattheei TaxID=31246 RepID=A0A183Q5F8_9TREM|nr:unnamed protein product [Schistosoma mattheei]